MTIKIIHSSKEVDTKFVQVAFEPNKTVIVDNRKYKVIDARAHKFSPQLSLVRKCIGIILTILSGSLAYFFCKPVKNLFKDGKGTIFYVVDESSENGLIQKSGQVAGKVFQDKESSIGNEKLTTNTNQNKKNELEQNSLKTSSISVAQKAEFKRYTEQCKEGVIIDSQILDETLESFGGYIEKLFEENYDGFHDGKPGPTYSGLKLFDMFEFAATNRENWQIKLDLDHQYKYCFNPQEEETALSIVKAYLTSRFKEKIRDIQIDEKKIHITWKS